MLYELLFTNERDHRGPLHTSVTNAIEYGEAAGNDGEEWEIWQLADDEPRTRMVMIKSGVMREIDGNVVAHYNPDGDDHSASRNVETLQREAPHLIARERRLPAVAPMEHATIVAAVIHYALHVADPSSCAAALEAVAPRVDGLPWAPALDDARRDYRATLDRAETGAL